MLVRARINSPQTFNCMYVCVCVYPLVTKLLSRCDKESRNWLVLSCAAKLPPKPTATGETWQSCRLGKEGVAVNADDNGGCGDSN